jgi:hypothetical protein
MSGTVWPQLQPFLKTPTPPELGPGPRPGVETETGLARRLDSVLANSRLAGRPSQLARAIVLLWHDHLDSAHTIAQDIADSDGAFVHGIMHRREPDFGNARYWFHRVGPHPAFAEIGARVQVQLRGGNSPELALALAPEGRWDALAFIDACERATRRGTGEAATLREIQRIETEVLLERFAAL